MAENKSVETFEGINKLKELIENGNDGKVFSLQADVSALKSKIAGVKKALQQWIRDNAERSIKETEAPVVESEPVIEEPKAEQPQEKIEQTPVVEEPIKAEESPIVNEEKIKEPEQTVEVKEEKKEEVKEPQKPADITSVPLSNRQPRRVYIPDPREQNMRGGRDSKKERGERPARTDRGEKRPDGVRYQGQKPTAVYKPDGAATFDIPNVEKDRYAKKKAFEKQQYDEKKTKNKRSLFKEQLINEDYDEDKEVVYRKKSAKKQKADGNSQAIKIEKAVLNSEIIPLKVLSEKFGVPAASITKMLFAENILKTINDSIDFDTAAFIGAELGIEVELKMEQSAEDVLSAKFKEEKDEGAISRPPVVAVMGHVDHGKTSLLDKIRKANVTEGEAGGITQHIGAYQVSLNGKTITFLDTPGHEAFTAMRQRGAKATDIAVIVVAADDGIMPQTVEAINHAKAAEVSIIVAVNKMDKPEANLDRVKTQLTEKGLVPEEWGGDIIVCPVSAKTGMGITELLESINTIAEIKEFSANPNKNARCVVIESKLDKNKGPVATVLVQSGTLKVADWVVAGTVVGKIRTMTDDVGRNIKSAGPSTPVYITGLDEVPNSGEMLIADQEKLVKSVAEERRVKEQDNRAKKDTKISLDDFFAKSENAETKVLKIIVKTDVQGSAEALKQSLEKIKSDEVKVSVLHAATGAISESDVILADSSNAIIIGFNVRPDANARKAAEKSMVDIKTYSVIYEALDDVEKAIKGMLTPKFQENYTGKVEVKETFKITGVGTVAGGLVTEGKIMRNGKLRIYRNDVMICEGNVACLKRFKDEVKEVGSGLECGIAIEKFNDIKVGDFIECYVVEEIK